MYLNFVYLNTPWCLQCLLVLTAQKTGTAFLQLCRFQVLYLFALAGLLLCLGAGTLFGGTLDIGLGLLVLGVIGRNGPFGQFHTDLILAGLHDDVILLNVDDDAAEAANGGNVVAHLQGVAHFLRLLLLLVLRTDHQEIHQGEHSHQHNQHAAHTGTIIHSGLSQENQIGHLQNSFV